MARKKVAAKSESTTRKPRERKVAFELNYTAEPTARKFHASDKVVRGIMGPVGSGKSVACSIEIFRRAAEQAPGPDGIRRSRWAIIRNSYPELKSTTIKTWQDWFPPWICPIKYDSPITGLLKINDIELELVFLALDLEKDVRKLLSLELTGVWFNEAKEIRKSMVEMATSRIGRFPALRDGGPTWSGIIMDTNPPDDDHWWYEMAEVIRPEDWEFFQQPPALIKLGGDWVPNPEAENIRNHAQGFGYYVNQISGKRDEWLKVYVQGLYGVVKDGRPCYPEYNDAVHGFDNLEADPDLPLLMGWDFGRTPAVAIGQLTPQGQLRILEEILVDPEGDGMGLRKFAREVVKPHLVLHYRDFEIISRGDPSGVAKGYEEQDAYSILAEEGIPSEPARTNDPEIRLDNVAYFLNAAPGGQPGLALDKGCNFLRKGFQGSYMFERMQVSGDTRYRDRPAKNRYSHVHDALQYLAEEARYGSIKMGRASGARAVKPAKAAGWT